MFGGGNRTSFISGILFALFFVAFFSDFLSLKTLFSIKDATMFAAKTTQKEDIGAAFPSDSAMPILIDRDWCPNAVCFDNHLCNTCQRRFLIIITSGRSASTTLTWTLNLLPTVRMGGENNGLITKIMDFYSALMSPPMVLHPPVFSAFDHNHVPAGSLPCVTQRMIESMVPPCFQNCSKTGKKVTVEEEAHEIIGFKTIRIRKSDGRSVDEIVNFLQKHIGCARYIINYSSDAEHQAISQSSAFQKKNFSLQGEILQVEKNNEFLRSIGMALGEQAIEIDSAEWTKNVTILNDAVRWLGFDQCDFPAVLELNTGRTKVPTKQEQVGPYSHGKTKLHLSSRCGYAGKNFSTT